MTDDALSARNLVNREVEFAEITLREVSFSNGLVLLGGKGNDSLTGDAFANIFGGTDYEAGLWQGINLLNSS